MTSTPAGDGDHRGDGAWIKVSVEPGCVVVRLGGEVDIRSSPKLGRMLEAVAPAALCLVIDMTHLAFIDSSGLGVLIHARNRARAQRTTMVLAHPPPLVRRLFASTRLQDTFTAYDTLDEALAALPRT